jgi:hypothetical protein
MTTAIRPRKVLTGEAVEAGDQPDYASAVYGSLLVTTLVVVQWRGNAAPELIGLSLVIAVASFWLAHVWSEIVAHRVHGPIDARAAGTIALSEATMLTSVVIPGLLLGLPRFVGMDVNAAIGAALIASLVQLFLWGLAVGRAAHATLGLALVVAFVDLFLGLAVVVLKVVVLH